MLALLLSSYIEIHTSWSAEQYYMYYCNYRDDIYQFDILNDIDPDIHDLHAEAIHRYNFDHMIEELGYSVGEPVLGNTVFVCP